MRRKASNCVEMCRDHVKNVENYIKKYQKLRRKPLILRQKAPKIMSRALKITFK